MFGMMEALLSFLRRQVGLRTDAANAAGSLHAKVGDVKNTVFSWHKKTATLSAGGITSLDPSTTQEVLRINGDRVVLGGQIVGSSLATFMAVTLKIDGATIFSKTLQPLGVCASSNARPMGYVTGYDSANVQWIIPLPNGLHFSNSFVVELTHDSIGGNAVDMGVAVWHVPA